MRTYLALLPARRWRGRTGVPAHAHGRSQGDPGGAGNIQDTKSPVTTPAPRGKQITLLYSSNGDGDYEQCGCPVHPLGGVTRRATVIDRARADADAALVLDAGDLFLPRPRKRRGGKRPDSGEIERRARLLAAAYGRIGTTAMLPGERDLVLGLPLLRRLAKQQHLPLLASNLYGRDGKRLFDADKIVDAAGDEDRRVRCDGAADGRGRRRVQGGRDRRARSGGGGARRGAPACARAARGSSWRWSTSAAPTTTASW